MITLNTEIEIDASPERVREVFFDFASYPQWNPFITSMKVADGSTEIKPGTPLEFVGLNTTMRPNVVDNTSERFSWLGTMFGKWFFAGKHIFEFHPVDGGKCRLVQKEEFTGAASSAIMALIKGKTEKGFKDMNNALKERVEAK